MKKQLGKSKWVTGLLVTLVMTMFMALPVMAKEYKVDLSAKEGEENSVESLPETLQEGDVLTLTSDKWNEYPATIWFQYEGSEGLSWFKYRQIEDSEKTSSCVVERVNDVSEWKVRTSQKYINKDDNKAGVFICLKADKNSKYDLEWSNKCKKGTVGEEYDTAFWVFSDLSKYPGYKSVNVNIDDTDPIDLPKGVKVRNGADPRNDGRMGINFKGTPTESGTFHPVIYGEVQYANDEGDQVSFVYKWSFTINIEDKNNDKGDKEDKEDKDDDDDHDEPAPSNNSSSNSTWTAPSSAPSQSQAPAQAAQISAVQTAVASVPTLLATNSAVYSRTGMPLNMTNVNTLDAATVNLLSTNNKIPYNVTITFAGNPFTVKIPAGFNYKSFVKADGSVNIHEVLWAVLSGQKR